MAYDLQKFREGCRELKLQLNEEQEAQFISYFEAMIEKNQVMNLTSITGFEEVIIKHFLDSLSLVKILDTKTVSSIIDVGTGAGFPGIPLKIAFPFLKVTLLDSLNKRVQFLNETCEMLGLKDIKGFHGRAEDFGRNKEFREKYDVCVSRAVSNLATLSEYCLPFVKTGGAFIPYKSGQIEEEVEAAGKAIYLLGGKLDHMVKFTLPESDIERSLLLIKKVRNTAGKYPRKAGTPLKEPLG